MRHVTHMKTSWHIFERIMSHNVMCHVICMRASRGAERAHLYLAPPAPPPPGTRRHTHSLSHPCSLARSLTPLPHLRLLARLLARFFARSLAPLLSFPPRSVARLPIAGCRGAAPCNVRSSGHPAMCRKWSLNKWSNPSFPTTIAIISRLHRQPI